jgi:hypothetical protein
VAKPTMMTAAVVAQRSGDAADEQRASLARSEVMFMKPS